MYALLAPQVGATLRPPLTTDFSEYAVGDASTQGWTLSSATGFSFTVAVAGSTGTRFSNKAIVINKTGGNASRFATFDKVPIGTTDFEILARVLIATVPVNNGETVGCLIGRYTNTTHYYIALPRKITGGSTKVFEIGKEAGSGPVVLDNDPVAFDATEFWWIRFRIVGTSVKAKMWRQGTSEPASWTVSATDTSNTAGKVGFATFYEDYNYRCDFFSVALGSATAPGPSG